MAALSIIILGLFFVQSIHLLPTAEAAPAGDALSLLSTLFSTSNDQPSYDLPKCAKQVQELGDISKSFIASARAAGTAAQSVILPLYQKVQCPMNDLSNLFPCVLGKLGEIRESVILLDKQLAEPFVELGSHIKNFNSDLHGCLGIN